VRTAVTQHLPAHQRAAVVSVNVGPVRTYAWCGRTMRSAIDKRPVDRAVTVRTSGPDGDGHASPDVHGGPDKAVYAYSTADYRWWEAELGRPLAPGTFGENLTVTIPDPAAAVIGERWRVGGCLLQVSEPRTPCWKLGMRMDDTAFPRRFARAHRTGILLRVLQEGPVAAGDPVTVLDRPAHGLTAGAVLATYLGEPDGDLDAVLAAPELAGHWHRWAEHRTVWHTLPPGA
jgi:MOSC domain-containing protein YiiM